MHDSVQSLLLIKNEIKELLEKDKSILKPKIIAVSKTFSSEKIIPLIESGHIDFGENKLQEAELKWNDLKRKYSNVKLHMVGKLQTNKVKKAIKIFDFIHSLDNYKLANTIDKIQKQENKNVPLFIQVNFDNEEQKGGISPNETKNFLSYCQQDLDLNVVGLMCLPPENKNPQVYFKKLNEMKVYLNLEFLSMGMTEDYVEATKLGSTHLRIGSKIFGPRN
tara:strand:- start:223 stop:885 length:663 start_codon:yes stop_codon:yes gene_type:complete